MSFAGMNFHSDEYMASLLRKNGYVVIPRERRVILEVSCVMPPRPEQLRMGKERLTDMIQRQQEARIARKLFDDGLVVNTLTPLSDPITGDEEVMRSYICVIKPK